MEICVDTVFDTCVNGEMKSGRSQYVESVNICSERL